MSFGRASGRASIGCAKSLLIGECKEPARPAASTAALVDADTGEQIGAAVRAADAVRPVYVSQGHRISIARAIEFTLAVADGFRIPRPTREADHFVNSICRQRKALADPTRIGVPSDAPERGTSLSITTAVHDPNKKVPEVVDR